MLMINGCALSCQACVSVDVKRVAVVTHADAKWISLMLFLANCKFNKVTWAVPEHQDRDGCLRRFPVRLAIVAKLHCGTCIVPYASALTFHEVSSTFKVWFEPLRIDGSCKI